MPTLDELSLRRPEFSGGIPITLADGQEWMFARPVIELYPAFRADGTVALADRPSFGPDYDDLLEVFLRADAGADELRALMGLAVHLLRINYDLEPAELGVLLRYRPGDEQSRDMWQTIADVATGTTANPPSAIGAESN